MHHLVLSPFIIGDPVAIAVPVTSTDEVLDALGIDAATASVLRLAPRVVLIHASQPGTIGMRWVPLRAGGALGADGSRIDLAIVLTSPDAERARTVRLVSRLKSYIRDDALVSRACAATSREELTHLLAGVDARAGEATLSEREILVLLASSPTGLTAGEAAERLRRFGENRLERVAGQSLLRRLLGHLTSFFAILLWVGSALALLAGLPELAWAIVVVIVVNGLFSFVQEYRAERALQALQALLPHDVTVVRDGVEARRPATQVVAGDLVRVDEGDQVPADGQLIATSGLRVDQSALTGESQPVSKVPAPGVTADRVVHAERPELVFAGTAAVAGTGTFVVTATGMETEIGGIARLTQSIGEHTSPLQREMRDVTRVVTAIAVSLGVAFFIIGVTTRMLTVTEGFVFALGVIVANVPEGLLPTLTIALAMGAKRLARMRSLVKRLSAVEGLGATTVVCTDKTGTLTENRMSVRFVWVSGRTIAAELVDQEPRAATVLEAATLASQATVARGDPMEVALVSLAARAGVPVDDVRRKRAILAPYPFESFRKRMTLVRATDDGPVAFTKGAPKELLALCRSVEWDDGDRMLTDDLRAAILAEHDHLAAEGLRLLGVARRAVANDHVGDSINAVECDLTFLGLVALWDPPRPEVREAVRLAERAGIRVVMITGDYGLTAQAIARQIGLAVDKVVTGDELDRLPPHAVRTLIGQRGVLFARTSPAHKLAIVTGLKELGEVVAVTGDGVNDAPALKAADTGVAMGKRGSDVAKEAAEVVITDDNFASIVEAIRQGRATYANMGKFVTYIFASNVPELVPFLACVLLRIPLPLTVMQILAVDLGTDLLPALALGAETPEPDLMDRPPRAPGARLLGPGRLLRAYAFLGIAEAALALLAFFWVYWLAGWRPGLPMAAGGELYRRATTMTLAGIVAAQVGNVLACRTDRASVLAVGVMSNRLVLGGIAAEIAILLGLMLVPPFPSVFGLVAPRFAEWQLLLAFPVAMLALEEARKLIVRHALARRHTPAPA